MSHSVAVHSKSSIDRWNAVELLCQFHRNNYTHRVAGFTIDNTSSLYRRMPYKADKTSGGRNSKCENCDVGSYASQNASQTCIICSKGKYCIVEGRASADIACAALLGVSLKQRDRKRVSRVQQAVIAI